MDGPVSERPSAQVVGRADPAADKLSVSNQN